MPLASSSSTSGKILDAGIDACGAAVREVEEVVLGKREVSVYFRVVADSGERLCRRGRCERAFAIGYNAYNAITGSGNCGVGQIFTGRHKCCVGLSESGFWPERADWRQSAIRFGL